MAGTVVDEEAIIKRDQWRELIAAHERSGLSVRVAQRHRHSGRRKCPAVHQKVVSPRLRNADEPSQWPQYSNAHLGYLIASMRVTSISPF